MSDDLDLATLHRTVAAATLADFLKVINDTLQGLIQVGSSHAKRHPASSQFKLNIGEGLPDLLEPNHEIRRSVAGNVRKTTRESDLHLAGWELIVLREVCHQHSSIAMTVRELRIQVPHINLLVDVWVFNYNMKIVWQYCKGDSVDLLL